VWDVICQFIIPVFGMTAILLLAREKKIGFIFGLIAAPFWFITSYINRQPGVFIANIGYAISWAYGVYRLFLKKWVHGVYRSFFKKSVNPNLTPARISLDEIGEIAQRGSEQTRFFSIESGGHTIPIVALPTVYFSEEFGDTQYYIEEIPKLVSGRFLEIGVGTGIVTIAVALENSEYFSRSLEKYVAVDINPQALKSARINIMINGLEDAIDVRYGDIFEALRQGEMFDDMFWAHPFHKGKGNENITQRAFLDPSFQGLEKYVEDGHKFLNKGGKQFLGSGNFADLDDMGEIMAKHGCDMHLIHYVHLPFKGRSGVLNTYNIYEIRKKA